jgi:hypothetical protein
MERMHYIGADTHCAGTDLAVVTQSGRLMRRDRCPTKIPELAACVERVRRPREVIIEEGPLADWICRGLGAVGEAVIVCNPRRPALRVPDRCLGDFSTPNQMPEIGSTNDLRHRTTRAHDRPVFRANSRAKRRTPTRKRPSESQRKKGAAGRSVLTSYFI